MGRLQLCNMQSALEARTQSWAHTPEFVPRSNSISSSSTGNGLNVSATPFVMSGSSSSDSDSDDGSLSGIAGELRSVLSRGIKNTSPKKRRKNFKQKRRAK